MKLRQAAFLLILLFFSTISFGQEAQKVIVSNQDPYDLYASDGKDSSTLFYFKLVPKIKPIGVLVIMSPGGETVENTMKQITLQKLAVDKGFIVLFPSINWGTVKFYAEDAFLDTIFKQVVTQYKISKDNFILGGLSGGGMIALRYAEKANENTDSTFIKPQAVFALDSPVDYENLYYQCQRDVERNFAKAAVDEGNWFMQLCKNEFGGTPEEKPSAYIKYSIYSHNERNGGNAKYLINTPILIYTEPAIEWQIKNRHRDLYDLNCTDLSAMINYLQLKGNKNASIIETHDKGFRLDGSRHPHSWSIMNSQQCLHWILQHLKS